MDFEDASKGMNPAFLPSLGLPVASEMLEAVDHQRESSFGILSDHIHLNLEDPHGSGSSDSHRLITLEELQQRLSAETSEPPENIAVSEKYLELLRPSSPTSMAMRAKLDEILQKRGQLLSVHNDDSAVSDLFYREISGHMTDYARRINVHAPTDLQLREVVEQRKLAEIERENAFFANIFLGNEEQHSPLIGPQDQDDQTLIPDAQSLECSEVSDSSRQSNQLSISRRKRAAPGVFDQGRVRKSRPKIEYSAEDYSAWTKLFANGKPHRKQNYELNGKSINGRLLELNYNGWKSLPAEDRTSLFVAYKQQPMQSYDNRDFAAWAQLFLKETPISQSLYILNGKTVSGKTLIVNHKMWLDLPEGERTIDGFIAARQMLRLQNNQRQPYNASDYAAWAKLFEDTAPNCHQTYNLNGKKVPGTTLEGNYRTWKSLPEDKRTPQEFVACKTRRHTYDTSDYHAWAVMFAREKPKIYQFYEINGKSVSGSTLSGNYRAWKALPESEQTPAGFIAAKQLKLSYDADDFRTWAELFEKGCPSAKGKQTLNGKMVPGQTLEGNYRIWLSFPKEERHQRFVAHKLQPANKYTDDDFASWAELFKKGQPHSHRLHKVNGKMISGKSLGEHYHAWLRLPDNERTPDHFIADRQRRKNVLH